MDQRARFDLMPWGAAVATLVATTSLLLASGAAAQETCWAIADSDKVTSSDQLIGVDPTTGISFVVGPLGTLDVEAAALALDGLTLYAADGGQLGTVDLASGTFSPLANPAGVAGGAAGEIPIDDLDSLSFDPTTGELYGVHRTSGPGTPDLLLILDPASGSHSADAFGPGVDYAPIPVLLDLESIDDIAIDPTGRMFALLNDDPSGFGDRLARIDKASGTISDVGALGVIDVEGLTFDAAGNLYASTGSNAPFSQRDRLFSVDQATGTATEVSSLFSLYTDYEALACAAPIDSDGDGVPDGQEGDDDRDDDGVPDDEDYDPTGYFYDELTGEILPGGSISVSGPGVATVLEDGSKGFYQFITDGTAGTYTITVTPPFGYEPSFLCLEQNPPPFDPTGGPNPTVLGNDEDGNSGFLSSNACTDFYSTFDLEAGDPFVFFNNFPMRRLPLCHVFADRDGLTSSDRMVTVIPSSSDSRTVGSLGTLDVEAAAIDRDGTVYASNGGQLGTVDVANGAFTTLPSPLGTAGGSAGEVTLSDVDSLTFDPTTGILYGAHRTDGANTPDLLFQIDPATGGHLSDAFGTDIDYVEIPVLLGLESIDDIAVDPSTGQMVAIANDDPIGFTDRLVRIDKTTGAISDVGAFGVVDVEGLSFGESGALFATTGEDAGADRDRLFRVDKRTGTATEISPLPIFGEDYEGIACGPPLLDAALGNRVWIDENADGRQDAGEPGLANIVVELYAAGATPGSDPPLQTTVTDSLGGYLFSGLEPELYQVRVEPTSLPAGLSQTANPVLGGLDGGNQSQPYLARATADENPTADFGYLWNPTVDVDGGTGTAALGDRVWIDADGDGAQDPAELGIGGVLLSLTTAGPDGLFGTGDDITTAATTTDAAGHYLFDGLAPGAYAVEIDTTNFDPGGALEGYAQTGDPDHFATAGINDGRTTEPVLLAPGDIFLNADFGYQPPADENNQVGDFVWLDADRDGAQDAGEPGIPGVTVALVLDDGDGLFDPANPGADRIVATTLTDANGAYLFDGVPDGRYIVWVNDTDHVLSSKVVSGDPDALLDGQSAVALDPSSLSPAPVVDLDQDFGYSAFDQVLGAGAIGDTVFLDRDGDGLADPGEGLEGVTVELRDASGVLVATTVTDENGGYLFAYLDPGETFTVRVDIDTLPPGLVNTVDPDDDGTPGNGDEDSTSVVDLTATGPVDLDQDFGYRPAATAGSIGNQIWLDTDADGLFEGANGPDMLPGTDDDEPGLAEVTVDLYLDTDGDGGLDPGEPRIASALTDADGLYLFIGLPVDGGAGGAVSYLVAVSDRGGVLGGYGHSLGPAAGDGTSDDNSQASVYGASLTNLAPDHLLADFGYHIEAAALGNRVWADIDADGVQDAGEPGLAGVTITLEITYPSGDVATLTTVTDSTGAYRFANLLLDEDLDGSGTPGLDEPTFVIRAATPTGFSSTVIDVGGNSQDLEDGDDPAGVTALPALGFTDVALQADPNSENNIASYDFGFLGYDFGDAVDPSYPTLLASGGARHALGAGLFLGASIDAESDGQVSGLADGDDILDGGDDEDGVSFPGAPLTPGDPAAAVDVIASGAGLLDAWIDFDQDGDWDDPGEQIFSSQALVLGVNNLTFAVPASALIGTTASRFRLSSGGGLAVTGSAVDGEVEDHTVAVGMVGSIGDRVWEDDGDGIQDGGEPGIDGITVQLLDAGGTVLETTITSGGGLYSFTGLGPGIYQVRFTAPAAYDFSPLDAGGDDDLDSDADPFTGETGPITLELGDDITNIDGGLTPQPTEALVADFRAVTEDGGVVVEWETTSEANTAGFYLYRFDAASADYVPVQGGLLRGTTPSPAGALYRQADSGAALGGTHTYLLAEVEGGTSLVFHGPYTVAVGDNPTPFELDPTGFTQRPRALSPGMRQRLEARHLELEGLSSQAPPSVPEAVKIRTDEQGLYRLAAEDIESLFALPDGQATRLIAAGELALTHRGQGVAWLPEPDGRGLRFFAEALDSPYARHDVYWLRLDAGRHMERVDAGSPRPQDELLTFSAEVHAEEDRFPTTLLPIEPEDDYWFWESLNAGHPTDGERSFAVPSPAAYDRGTATLTVHLHGVTTVGLPDEHRIEVEVGGTSNVGGTLVGTSTWRGVSPHRVSFELDPELLADGPNVVTVRGLLGPGIPHSVLFVDGFDLRYERTYEAREMPFAFPADPARVLTIRGLRSAEAQIFDITDPHRPRLLEGVRVEPEGAGYRASLAAPAGAARFLASDPASLRAPIALELDRPSRLLEAENRADYLIIAPFELFEGARELARYRRSRGFEAEVVVLQDIMDELNHGVFDPRAIHAFLAHAHSHWQTPPRFVALVGNGTFDYLDRIGVGDNLLPPMMVLTAFGLYASDNRYVDLEGDDGVPEIAIGRLPVLTNGELLAYLEKLEAYELGALQADQASRTLWAADDPDAAGDFDADSERLAELLPRGFEAQRVQLSRLGIAAARAELLEALERGVSYFSYIGHGGLDRMADEGLLTLADIPTLTNHDALPIVTGMTCAINRFAIPGFASLGEQLTLHPEGGAIAVWAPTGLSLHRQAMILAESYVRTAYQTGRPLGEVVNAALAALRQQGGSRQILAIYNLIGDPATFAVALDDPGSPPR